MTLVEILLALGALSTVIVGIATQTTQIAKMNTYLNQSYGYSQLSREIANATKSSLLCTEYNFRLTPPQAFDYTQASTANGQDVVITMSGSNVGNNSTLANYGVSETVLKLSNVSPLGIANSNGDPMYQGLIKISGKRSNPQLGSDSFKQRLVSSVVFAVRAGQISGCYGGNDVPIAPCTVDPATGQCQSSFPPSALQTCPPGSIATGYQGGILRCQQVNETCPASQVVVAINNGKALCGNLPPPSAPPPLPPTTPGTGEAAQFVMYSHIDCSMVTGSWVVPAICSSFGDPTALSTQLSLPECTKPELNKKCFRRDTFKVDGVEGGTSYMARYITIMIGIPLY